MVLACAFPWGAVVARCRDADDDATLSRRRGVSSRFSPLREDSMGNGDSTSSPWMIREASRVVSTTSDALLLASVAAAAAAAASAAAVATASLAALAAETAVAAAGVAAHSVTAAAVSGWPFSFAIESAVRPNSSIWVKSAPAFRSCLTTVSYTHLTLPTKA